MSAPPIWSLSSEAVIETLQTTIQGLSSQEALHRLKHYGANELPEPAHRPLWLRFTDQLTHFMALLLWVAGILAFVSGTPELGWAIWAVIWINAIFSFSQEFQAERALAALKGVLPTQVKVFRDGNLRVIPARELVPGDAMQIEEGDRISADARLISAQSLYLDVSVLTGESLPVAREATLVPSEGHIPTTGKVQPAEMTNLVLTGSTVAAGRGLAVVYATGTRTEFGHVAHLTTTVKRESSTLEIQIARIVRVITSIALGMGLTVFLLSYFLVHMAVGESFIFAIGIIVANVPEGLLPTVTLALAISVQRMAQQNALVRRLSAVETLSATTIICTDKTGTLTKNEMTVRVLWIPSTEVEVSGTGYEPIGDVHCAGPAQAHVNLLLAGGALCSNARLIHLTSPAQGQATPVSSWQEIGDPTEAALLVAALKAQLVPEALQHRSPRLREIPFDSRRRMMTVVLDWRLSKLWPNELPYLSFTKGAPLEVLRCCGSILNNGQVHPLSKQERDAIAAANDQFASQGFRVLGVAVRKGDHELLAQDPQTLEQDLTFLGLVAMQDPPRPEVDLAIDRCHRAGIAVTMITGDYGLTAAAIARSIGLSTGKARVITGEQLEHLSAAQLRQLLHRKTGLIFARVAPEQKLRLVQAYQDLGQVVAVTGDGVNDAPALRAANIGVAMGLSGTDVAREAADIVLTDDNFATIVSAIEQGRAVYQNIRKFMTYILTSNVPQIVPFLAMVAFKIPPALTVLQILAVDLGTDMVPALALGADPPEPGIMHQPPRSKHKSLLSTSLLARAYGFLGVIEAIAAMLGFFAVWWSQGYTLAELQQVTTAILNHTADASTLQVYRQSTTVTLAVIVACQVGNLFACRSEYFSITRVGFFSNRWIGVGIATEWVVLFLLLYVYPLREIFATVPLTPQYWFMLLMWPPLLLGLEELRKYAVHEFKRGEQ